MGELYRINTGPLADGLISGASLRRLARHRRSARLSCNWEEHEHHVQKGEDQVGMRLRVGGFAGQS